MSDEKATSKMPDEVAPKWPTWDCQLKPFDGENSSPLESLYVGDLFLIHCQGDFVDNFQSPIKITAKDDAAAYGLVVLEERSIENSQIWAVATSYKPGEHKLENFNLNSGEIAIPLSAGVWQIQSALAERSPEVANNPESQKMILKGPFELPMPLWYLGIWIGLILIICAFISKVVIKRLQRKKVLEKISRKATALTPYNQFNKEIRQHMRQFSSREEAENNLTYMNELDQTFKLYLTRELLVPATEWNVGSVMGELKTRHKKVYKRVGPQVRRVLVEFQRAQRSSAPLSWEDCEQMKDMSRRVVDNVYRINKVSQ